MNQIQNAVQEIHRLTDQIIKQATDLSVATLHWKPSEQGWSVMEVLCHVEEAILYWLEELKHVVKTPGVEWGRGIDHPGRLAAVAHAKNRTFEDVLQGIHNTKQTVSGILGSMTESDLAIEAPSRNPKFGTKPMSFIVQHQLVEHLNTHLNQINRNLQQHTGINQPT